MGPQTDSTIALSERPRFASLREAQAIWRVLNGDSAEMVSSELDVPVTILVQLLEQSGQVREPRMRLESTSMVSDQPEDSGRSAFPSS